MIRNHQGTTPPKNSFKISKTNKIKNRVNSIYSLDNFILKLSAVIVMSIWKYAQVEVKAFMKFYNITVLYEL